MKNDQTFESWFEKATGNKPYPFQKRFACDSVLPQLVDVPTGMGKTAMAVLGWIWRRRFHPDEGVKRATPRRLVYCLPMRVLVDQTHRNACEWLQRLGLLGQLGEGKISAHPLMGGADDLRTWVEYPDEDMILIGTQDMLLSRALMRGYGMSRYQWPIHFALLHNDALWVFDEVQLMGGGLSTSAQLEAFRRRFPLARASRSIWLSATLNQAWLATVDMESYIASLQSLSIGDEDRRQAGDRVNAIKAIERAPFIRNKEAGNKKGADAYLKALCDTVLNAHDSAGQTLVIVNRVDRAQGLFRLLRERRAARPDLLIHARFRRAERAAQSQRLREEASGKIPRLQRRGPIEADTNESASERLRAVSWRC
jgi:CRISPR-associated endonuclease/helicase Cas3